MALIKLHTCVEYLCVFVSILKGKKSKPVVGLTDEQVAEVMDMGRMKRQMEGALEDLKQDFIQNLSIRSSAGE